MWMGGFLICFFPSEQNCNRSRITSFARKQRQFDGRQMWMWCKSLQAFIHLTVSLACSVALWCHMVSVSAWICLESSAEGLDAASLLSWISTVSQLTSVKDSQAFRRPYGNALALLSVFALKTRPLFVYLLNSNNQTPVLWVCLLVGTGVGICSGFCFGMTSSA